MERMEVDQCAGAAAGSGGGALRRSNSAPMISGVSDAITVFSPSSSARYRRSSVSVNHSCPGQPLPLSPFSLTSERPDHKRLEESMELNLRENLQRMSASSSAPHPPVTHWNEHISLEYVLKEAVRPPPFTAGLRVAAGPIVAGGGLVGKGIHSLDSGVTPNSSPSPTRRFRGRAASNDAVRWPTLTPLKRKGGVESDGPPKKLFVAGVTDPPHITGYTVSVAQAADSPFGGFTVCSSPQGSPLSLSPPPSFTSHHPSI